MSEDLKGMIGENEKILWEGKPSKKCFILESIFNPLLPFLTASINKILAFLSFFG